MYRKILLLILAEILALGCTRVEMTHRVLEGITTTGTWTDSDYEVIAVLTVIPEYTNSGKQFLGICIQNVFRKVDTKQYAGTISEPESGDLFPVTLEEFQTVLKKVNALERTGDSVQFTFGGEGCRISWKMFDEIYSKYYYESNR